VDTPETPRLWVPTSEPIKAADLPAALAERPMVVVHFWAVWDSYDRILDVNLRPLREAMAETVSFRSVDVDDPALVPLCRDCGVANVPTLVAFMDARQAAVLVGVRPAEAIREWIEQLAANAAPMSN